MPLTEASGDYFLNSVHMASPTGSLTGGAAPRTYGAGGVGWEGRSTLCQVSWMTPAFSDRISMSRWASPSLNTMLPTVETRVL